jgi:3-mercaptopyruvate sulfurtransferase SseA
VAHIEGGWESWKQAAAPIETAEEHKARAKSRR